MEFPPNHKLKNGKEKMMCSDFSKTILCKTGLISSWKCVNKYFIPTAPFRSSLPSVLFCFWLWFISCRGSTVALYLSLTPWPYTFNLSCNLNVQRQWRRYEKWLTAKAWKIIRKMSMMEFISVSCKPNFYRLQPC